MGNQNARQIEMHVDRALRIRELEKEIESLKSDNNALRRELTEHHARATRTNEKQHSEISVAQVDAFVDALIADPATNVAYIPDAIERPLERKMLLYVLNALAHVVDSAQINFMGHELLLRLQPLPPVAPVPPVKAVVGIVAGAREAEAYSEYDEEAYSTTNVEPEVEVPPPIIELEVSDKGKGEIDINSIPL